MICRRSASCKRLALRDVEPDRGDVLDGVELVEVRVRIEGRVFDVMVGSETPTRLVGAGYRASVTVKSERERSSRTRGGSAADSKELRAPMPGLIVKVLVSVGDSVEPGAPLVVMEAMKMENELRAAGAGVVAAIEVREGQNVESAALLVRFE